MPPLPDNVTQNWYIDYFDGLEQHTALIRSDVDVDTAAFMSFWNDWIDAVGPMLVAETLVNIRTKQPTDTASFPIDTTGFTTSWGSGSVDPTKSTRYVDFVGRGGDGVRTRTSMFGLNVGDAQVNFRFAPGENGQVDSAIGIIQAATGIGFTVSGSGAIWQPYANSGYNAYWQRKHR